MINEGNFQSVDEKGLQSLIQGVLHNPCMKLPWIE